MNSGYNSHLYHIPVAVESLCQQSMYQQHTYVDRTRMAVTDVFVQEHVSQSSWTMSTPPIPIRPPVFIQNGRGPYMGGNGAPPPAAPQPPPQHHPSMHGRFTYMSMPSVHYYAASSGKFLPVNRNFGLFSIDKALQPQWTYMAKCICNIQQRPRPMWAACMCHTIIQHTPHRVHTIIPRIVHARLVCLSSAVAMQPHKQI